MTENLEKLFQEGDFLDSDYGEVDSNYDPKMMDEQGER